jgi:pyruvate-formate lyase
MPATTLSGLVRGLATLGGATFQPNVVDVAVLRDAEMQPERHRDLTARVCGLSARFATLTREVQDEIIARHAAGV